MPFSKASVLKPWMLFSLLALAGLSVVRAQLEPLSPPVPFKQGAQRSPAGPVVNIELAALRALHLGLPTIAAELYRKTLDELAPSVDANKRNSVIIDLATALIEDDRYPEAAEVLRKFTGLPSAALRLRLAMIAVRDRRLDAARTEVQAINPDEFTAPYDRGWYFFVRGQLATDPQQAGAFYQQADNAAIAAGLEAQRAWFVLAKERLKLRAGGSGDVTVLEATIKRNPGSAQAYQATGQLAVGLFQSGRQAEAVKLLQDALDSLPPEERGRTDEWRLLLGMIAGPEDSVGWLALRNLLINSTDRDHQRAALRYLSRAARNGARREDFGRLLDQLIESKPQHPILEYLLLFRAQATLFDNSAKGYSQAEADATRVLNEFPNSPLKASALGVLTEAAWERGFYRRAATHAAAARAVLGPGETRARLGVLQAEAYFRAAEIGKTATDYRTAADAYGAALAEVPAGVPPGDLMFQRVLSAINAGQLVEAERILDELSLDPRLEASYRWQMEWNLARALQVAGDAPKAYERVNRLLGNALTVAGLSADLRASMGWLQARLAFENGDPARTLALAETLVGALDGVSPSLKAEIASNALLLQAQAGFALKEAERTKEAVRKLRAEYPSSDAAVYSYIVEADAADAEGRVLDAQRHVRDLADNFKKSEYAPYALYRAALYAERQGPARTFSQNAYDTLEDLVQQFPDDPLVFYARLKQGNLLRNMNEAGRARTLYADLVNKFAFPQFADALSAQIALADTYATLASTDPANAGNAASIYERLYDLQAASIDLRAEAGHKLGLYREERESDDRAYAIWWPMIDAFVLDDATAAKLGGNGRYWMSRTIVRLAALQERLSKPRQARELYEIILAKKLPGEFHAREGLARTGAKASTTANGTAR